MPISPRTVLHDASTAIQQRSLTSSPAKSTLPPGADGHDASFRLLIEETGNDADSSGTALLAPPSGRSRVEPKTRHPLLPIACYCLTSITMTVANKFVVSARSFDMNFLMLGLQSSVCVLCVVAARQAQLIHYRSFTSGDVLRWMPVSLMLVSVIYTGSKSLQFLAVSIYTIFKNLAIILTAYGEAIWFGAHVTPLTLFSFTLMVISSIVAAWADPQHSDVEGPRMLVFNQGYLWMLGNVCASAMFVLGMRKRMQMTQFRDVEVLFLNNALSIPILLACSLLTETWTLESLGRNFPESGRVQLLLAIGLSGAIAAGISYTTAWCIRETSSTTYSMVGSLNKLPIAASGIIFFNEPLTRGSFSAISLGGLAGIVYAVAKTKQQKHGVQSTARSNYLR